MRALEAAPEFAGKNVWTVSGGGLLGVAGGGAVALVFGWVGDAGGPRTRVLSCSALSGEDTDVGTGDAGSLVAYGWYLLFTAKRPAWCSSRALMKESSEPQLKGEGGGDGGSGEGLRTPVGAVRDFTVEEVFGTLEAWYTVQEGVVYGCEGLALGRPVGLEASGRQARKRRNFSELPRCAFASRCTPPVYPAVYSTLYPTRRGAYLSPGRVGVQGSRGTDEEIS